MIEVIKDGKVVSRSKNLAGMRRYAGKHGVEQVSITKDGDTTWSGAHCTVIYGNGAICRCDWADFSICLDRMRRWKYFRDAKHLVNQ